MGGKHITAKALAKAKKAVSPLVFPTHDVDFYLSDTEYDGAVMDKIKALYKEIPAFEHEEVQKMLKGFQTALKGFIDSSEL